MEERKNSAARIRANNKYAAKAYDRINIAVPKGRKDVIQEYAQQRGESINAFIGRAISEAMERDGGGTAAPGAIRREAGTAPASHEVYRILATNTAGSPQEAAGAAAVAGGISLPPDALEAAQRAAERAGEAVEDFLARAVQEQAKRDEISLHMELNPATGGKLDSKGGADHE